MSSDPLTALRRCIRDHKAQAHDPTTREITLDTEKFPADTPTRFRNKMGDPYSLGALWFFYITYVSNGVQHQQYVSEAATQDFQPVSIVDAKLIKDFLTGLKDEDSIDRITKLSDTQAAESQAAGAQQTANDAPKGLSAILTSDKVAELKAKRQKTRGDTDVLTSAVYSAQASVKEILARERPYLDRKTVLQAPKKNFSKLLDRLVEIKNGGKAKAALAAAQSSSSRPAAGSGASRSASHAASSYTSSRPAKTGYDRFEQSEERVMKASGIELEMNINTRGTFDDSAFGTSAKPNIFSAANSAAASKKRSYDQMAANEPTDMDMDIDDDYSRPAAPAAPAPAPAAASKKHSQSAEPPKKKRKYPDASLDPIILVPNANDAKAMLHASNAVKFLQDGEYVDDRSSRTRQFNVERNKFDGNGKVSYLVSDGSRMHAKDWDRVVCVVLNGTEWQFKSFPSELQTPANLFTRVKGYFLRYDDDPAPATVRSWNVAQLTISKPRRHLDQAASKRFWEELEQFIHTTRPEIKH